MFQKLSVLIPTRGRVERLRTLLESYDRTTGDGDISELVFRIDDDDQPTYDFLLPTPHVMVVGPRHQGYQSMPLFFNEALRSSSGDVLMCGNDDMVFRTPRWRELILEAANRYPDGLFDLGVSTHNETHYPFSIISRRVTDRLGFIWDPSIFWGDIYLRDVMSHFGRTLMLPNVHIEHDWAGNRPDQVFMESDKNITLRDRTYWTGTHTQAVQAAVQRLQEFA